MKHTIVLIGMSGVGKSYHSRKLAKAGYKVFSIDDMIAKALGEGDVHDVASFLGQPFEEKYKEGSKKYLELEEKFTQEAILYAKNHKDAKIVIDTTGSVIYISSKVLDELQNIPNVVFLESDETLIKKMIKQYLLDPKPVIWGDMARDFTKENYREKLTHLYPELLKTRKEKYIALSKKRIPFKEHKTKGYMVS